MPSTLRGNLAVGQSGGPTAVINATLVGVLHEAGKHAAIENIYGLRHGVEGLLKEDLMDLGGVSEELLERIKHTPAAALGSCRRKLRPDDYTRILEVFRAHNIRYFLYNGGNDSMDTCQRIADLAEREGYEIRVIGVPKTIDNDLMYTDHSPGYGSAARYCAMSVRDMGRDVEAMAGYDRVALYESMGRHAGWLTAASCLGKVDEIDPPHLVYLPEVPFSEERFLDDVSRCFVKFGFATVAVAEMLKTAEGEIVGLSEATVNSDSFGHIIVAGSANYLARRVRERLGIKARANRPGTLQRSSMVAASTVDREEAYMVGRAAVQEAIGGAGGVMITLERTSNDPYQSTTGTAPLAAVANAENCVPRAFINKDGNMPSEAFRDYALPLIGDSLPPVGRLAVHPVEKRTMVST